MKKNLINVSSGARLLLLLPLLVSAQWLETTIPVGDGPCALVYNSINNKVYCANDSSNDVTVIDGATNIVVTTIPVGDQPRALIYNPTNNKVYCANWGSDNVTVIDGANDTVITTITAGNGPSALAYNQTNNKIYCANGGDYDHSVTVIDGASNTVITTIWVGNGPGALVWNSTNNKVYCANHYSNAVTVIDGETDSVISTIWVGGWPQYLIWNAISNKVYCDHLGPGNPSSAVTIIDCWTDSVITLIHDIGGPAALVWNSQNNKVYFSVSALIQSHMTVIDGEADSIIAYINCMPAHAMTYNAQNNKIYCAMSSSDDVTVIDGAADSVMATITVGDSPYVFTWNPVQNRTYVANYNGSSVSVIRDVTGIEEDTEIATPSARNDFVVSPNPAKTFFTIHSSAPMQSIKIYDVLGKLVRTEDMTQYENRTTISVRNISAGIYFLKLNTADTESIKKLIVTK